MFLSDRQFCLCALVLGFAAVGAGCGKTEAPKPVAAVNPLGEGGCAGLKLKQSGICEEEGKSLLQFAPGPRPKAPSGCEWALAETELAGGDYLLYLAAKCGGKMRQLEYSGGAHKAELKYGENGPAVVSIYGMEPGEGNAAVLRHARELIKNKAEAAKCAVRPAGVDGWPGDALVVDVSAAEAAKARKDEPRSACGPLGLNEDAQMFWRTFQTFAWYFDLGQDEFEIDPGSLTMVVQQEGGKWSRVKN